MIKQNWITNLLVVILWSGCTSTTSTHGSDNFDATDSKDKDVSHTSIETDWYEIVFEKKLDKKAKAQIELKIIIDPKTTDQNLKSLLDYLYNEVLKRDDFTFFDNPTNIFIYAFDSNKVTNFSSEWRGMVSKGFSQSYPDYTIKKQKEHVEKLVGHIDLKTKKEIYYKSYEAEIRSQNEADKEYPTNLKKNILPNIDYMRELDDKYQAAICKEYNITEDQLSKIGMEGIKNNWPYPKY